MVFSEDFDDPPFILSHKRRIPDDIGEHDRGEAALLFYRHGCAINLKKSATRYLSYLQFKN
jgi:hypothetical protein